MPCHRILLGLWATLLGLAMPSRAEDRPNIILVMADDLGWGQVGYYNHPDLDTPHLDAMARAGLRLDRFYAGAPVCSPTRASVLTGRSNDRTGAISHGYALRRQEHTLAQALGQAGYATAHFGKWHLNALRGPGVPLLADDPYHPGHFGFDHWLTTSNFFDLDPLMSRMGQWEDFQGDSSEVTVNEALRFIAGREDPNQPFLAVLWFGTPHSPFAASEMDAVPFSHRPEEQRDQYGEIIAMDRSIGALRKGLREMDVAQNTLIWFCSDNGGLKAMGPETVRGLRGFKGDLYEGGIRVPAIIEWPAVIAPGRSTNEPAATMDIYPTLADIVNLPAKATPHPQDGISLFDLLAGRPFKRSHRIPFRHIGRGALIEGDYKLISQDYANGVFELYHLDRDPAEQHNLIEEEPATAARLIGEFQTWSAAVDRSAAGLDYQEGRLTRPDPEPVHWTTTDIYAPFLEAWMARPEYGYWIQKMQP